MSKVKPVRERDAQLAATERITGVVKWYEVAKGYGFISRDDNGADVFVHFTQIRGEGHKELHKGQKVEFAVARGPKGLAARDVNLCQEDLSVSTST